MLKRTTFFFLVIFLVFSISFGFAESIQPYADSVFMSAYISLANTRDATFVGKTYDEQASIYVTSCTLQKKDSSGWFHFCNLPSPPEVCTNTYTYGGWADYASFIGVGTYRIKATFNADGYEITRYSNERSF